jgi:hypothetical protein
LYLFKFLEVINPQPQWWAGVNIVHLATNNVSPRKQIFNKKTFQAIKRFYATDINTHTVLVMGDPPFFLPDLSQPLGQGGHTSFCTSALLLFQCALKLIILNLIPSSFFI